MPGESVVGINSPMSIGVGKYVRKAEETLDYGPVSSNDAAIAAARASALATLALVHAVADLTAQTKRVADTQEYFKRNGIAAVTSKG